MKRSSVKTRALFNNDKAVSANMFIEFVDPMYTEILL